MNIKTVIFTVCILIADTLAVSANATGVDFLRSTGKIYSVVAVIVVIFIGIVLYLYRLDKKLTILENQIKDEQ